MGKNDTIRLASLGYDPGKPIGGLKVDSASKTHKLPLRFTRRRYPGQTYTWVSVFYLGSWHELGDPWPCIRPKDAEIDEAINYLISRLDKPEVVL